MIFESFRNTCPKVHPTVRAAKNAVLLGNVVVKENASIWYGAIIRGDVAPIVIGANSNIQDGCILHNSTDTPTIIGKNVSVGHGTILHGCTIEDNCLIGMGAILLDGCIIGEGSIIAAGSLITGRTVIPPGSMVMGSPGKVVRTLRPDEMLRNLNTAQKYIALSTEQLSLCTSSNEAEL